jgi:hypothetical protein
MLEFGVRLDPKGIQKFTQKLAKYQQALMDASVDGLKAAGELYCEIVIGHMGQYTGDEMVFSDTWWKALSEKWLKEKQARGLVEEIWEATGETKGYVKIYSAQKTANGWSIFAGLQDVPIDVLRKALENEFGSEVFAGSGATPGMTMYIVPARPLFEPAKREMIHVPAHRQILTANFAKAVKQAYKVVAYGQR